MVKKRIAENREADDLQIAPSARWRDVRHADCDWSVAVGDALYARGYTDEVPLVSAGFGRKQVAFIAGYRMSFEPVKVHQRQRR